MLSILSWRNIWRSKVRSLVIITAIALGLWGGVFMMGLSFGMSEQRKEDLIKTQLSHIQIHQPAYLNNREVKHLIPGGQRIAEQIRQDTMVKAATARVMLGGMISSAAGGHGVMIIGVDPETETTVTNIHEKLTEGAFLEGKGNQLFIGESLAHKLKVKLRSKVVLTFQDTSGSIRTDLYRIGGLFRTVSSMFDESTIYARQGDLNKTMETEGIVHEIALLVQDQQMLPELQENLKTKHPALEVRNWKEVSPELKFMDEMMDSFLYLFLGIILLALTFGLVNTMLMAILERTRELGMLMAVGMTRIRVFLMIVIETTYLTLVGGAAGMGLAYLTISWLGKKGLNLEFMMDGLEMYGMSPVIYPQLDFEFYPKVTLMIIAFAIISSIYPAWKALRLKPVEAIRKI